MTEELVAGAIKKRLVEKFPADIWQVSRLAGNDAPPPTHFLVYARCSLGEILGAS